MKGSMRQRFGSQHPYFADLPGLQIAAVAWTPLAVSLVAPLLQKLQLAYAGPSPPPCYTSWDNELLPVSPVLREEGQAR